MSRPFVLGVLFIALTRPDVSGSDSIWLSTDMALEPNPKLARPLKRPLGELELVERMKSVQRKSKEQVLRILGHPHRVGRDKQEWWVYQWNEECVIRFEYGVCVSYSISE